MIVMIGVVAGAAASNVPVPLVVMRQVRMQGVTLGSRADFEAMLRRILADGEGNTLAVTLLSSDMGKLYVALAQAIQHLRV